MPVTKYKNASDMPPVPRVEGLELIERIRVLWNRAFALSPPDFPRGVTRFRSISDANSARFDLLVARLRRNASPDRSQAEGRGRDEEAGRDVRQHADSNDAPPGSQDGGTSSAG